MSAKHHEVHFETYIVEKLKAYKPAADAVGWVEGTTADYDIERALYPEDIESWIKATQPKKWAKLEALNGANTEQVVLDRLVSELDAQGTVQVLRRGFPVAGCGQIDMSESAPEDQLNETVIANYRANRLRVVRQLKYHPTRVFAIDLVFFINGIPVATVEVKTDFTQSVEDAMEQYKADRRPVDAKTKRKEPLLTFKRGAVVHFAMSDSEIQMTTRLDGDNTFFLPFNQGRDGGAGNPARDDGEYPVAYFWEQVCQPDEWLRIFHSFVFVEKKDVVDLKGNWKKKETQIFPRFHQWQGVNAMIADAKANGAGMSYLCEHSAGSGKTNTIAWTSHDLIRLRSDDGQPVFHSVIVVTDRNVLDGQLQDAVQQIDHQFGVIAAIDREKSSKSKSVQLAEALSKGVPIIVVTIQTFPYAMEALLTEKSLADKRFAVIIDEAHNSQTGSTASKLQATLAMKDKSVMADMTIEELLEHIQSSRVRPKNVSHFAFTATPKHSTMMLFGRPKDPTQPASDDNLPESFHKYPMRQAIEEGFILDVLQNYTPYSVAYNLGDSLESDKRVDKKQARKALAQWMSLHPTNITQKVEFIVEHFHRNVMHLLDGKAKAMVVTSSRAAAVRYKKAFDAYITKHPEHAGIKALVAFSGSLTSEQVNHPADENIEADTFRVDPDQEFTEANMNPDAGSQDLRHVFDRPQYRVMLVANKFQTGFDQPKLVAMYIDKKIANDVEIVQTLSRLNRTHPGKDQTFIIDFVNDPNSIRKAFALYDDGATIEQVQDPNVVYQIKSFLDAQFIYDQTDLEVFKTARFKAAKGGITDPAHKALFAATQRPTDIFNKKLKELKDVITQWDAAWQSAYDKGDEDGQKRADHERSQYTQQREDLMLFKSKLAQFGRIYGYVSQLIDFGDPELENFAAFARLLSKRLDGVTPENVDLSGLVLTGFEIDESGVEPGEPDPGDLVLDPTTPGGTVGRDREKQFLREIIQRLNDLFGEVTPLQDQIRFANGVADITRENAMIMAQIENNSKENALKGGLDTAVKQAIVRSHSSGDTLAKLLLNKDQQTLTAFTALIYDLLKSHEELSLDP